MRGIKEAIGGGTHWFCFSLRVLQDIMDRYGTLEAMLDKIDGNGLEDTAWLASRMMLAGEKYAKRRGCECDPAMSAEDIMDELGAEDIVKLKTAIFATIAADSESEVQTADENPQKAGE